MLFGNSLVISSHTLIVKFAYFSLLDLLRLSSTRTKVLLLFQLNWTVLSNRDDWDNHKWRKIYLLTNHYSSSLNDSIQQQGYNNGACLLINLHVVTENWLRYRWFLSFMVVKNSIDFELKYLWHIFSTGGILIKP